MLIRARLSASLDGFVATPGGWPTVNVDPRGYQPHNDEEFLAGCVGVVWGRTGFDQGFGGGWETWPWPDKKVFVLTSRPLPEQASEVDIVAADGPKDLLAKIDQASQAGQLAGDVHVAGGGKAIQSLLKAGAIDRLHLHVLPILVGAGVPLFDVTPTPYTNQAWQAASDAPPAQSLAGPLNQLELQSHQAFDDGVVELVYAPTQRPENELIRSASRLLRRPPG